MVAVTAEQLQVNRVVGLATDRDAVATVPGRLRPVRGQVVAQPGDVLEHDDGTAAAHAADLEVQRRHRALLDGARVDVELLRCRQSLVPLLNAVQLDVEARRDLAYDRTPRHGQDAWLQQHRNVIECTAEAHDVEQEGAVVVRVVVEDLQAAHLVDTFGDAGHHKGAPVVGEARIDAVDPQRRTALGCRFADGVTHIGGHHAVGVLQEDGRARHHIDAGPQDLLQIFDRLHQPGVRHGCVYDAIRLHREQRIRVIRRSDAEVATEAGQLSCVLADFVGTGDPDADELEIGSGVDASNRVPTDVAGAPLNDAVGHWDPLVTGPVSRSRG